MINKIKILPFLLCSGFVLQGCNGDSDEPSLADQPKQTAYISSSVYANLTAENAPSATLFSTAKLVAESGGGTGELCDVTVSRISYDTIGGNGEAITSSGVVMAPTGDSALCSGPRPVVLYAHGTNTDTSYDLSAFIGDSSNPAASESVILLATYASQGYVVVAPNYAGYAHSNLGYHPYLDEVQQSTDMIDALEYARSNEGALNAEMSDVLFVSGLSQGGYVAMATHKALEAKGEVVKASMPISGPYATLDFMDMVFNGYVNGGATQFAPMYLTALDRAHDIYDEPSEVYAAQYADFADNALPRPGGFSESGLPEVQLFSGDAPANAPNTAAFGEDHLLADSFRAAYLMDAQANPLAPENKIRALVKESDLRDWTPVAPLLMCGAGDDPVVYHTTNSDSMAAYWSDVATVTNLDLTDDLVLGNPFMPIQAAWQFARAKDPAVDQGAIAFEALHGQTGAYCSFAGLAFFNQLKSN